MGFFLILYFLFRFCLSMLCSIVANFGTHPVSMYFIFSCMSHIGIYIHTTYTKSVCQKIRDLHCDGKHHSFLQQYKCMALMLF